MAAPGQSMPSTTALFVEMVTGVVCTCAVLDSVKHYEQSRHQQRNTKNCTLIARLSNSTLYKM